ncbi:MAG: hypothetical protein RIR12_1114 [Bacteroidota bacterium]|jgi:hypothetical protein
MRKAIFTLSVFCYLIASSGMVVNYHYCMKRLASVDFFETSSEVCGMCGMETHDSNGCCHDEVKVVKLTQEQTKAISTYFKFDTTPMPSICFGNFITAKLVDRNGEWLKKYYPPPLLSAQDTYLQINVFRI